MAIGQLNERKRRVAGDVVHKRNRGRLRPRESGVVISRMLRSQRSSLRFLPPAFNALARAVNAKDPYTGGHCDRVSVLAVLIARRLGLDSETCRDIAVGAMVHDVGKIGVSSQLLNKEGSLTPEEVREIQRHPLIGESILQPLLPDLPVILGIVRSHHERVDGRGYPDGLRAEAIPLPARIVAVADAFDAMTSRRAYRAAKTLGGALDELVANIGVQFDGRCVRALESIVRQHATGGAVRRTTALPELVAKRRAGPGEMCFLIAPRPSVVTLGCGAACSRHGLPRSPPPH